MKIRIKKSNLFYNLILIILVLFLVFLGDIEPANRNDLGMFFILNMDSDTLFYLLLTMFSLLLMIKATIIIYRFKTKSESVKKIKIISWIVSFLFLSCVILYSCFGFSLSNSMSDYYTFNFQDRDKTIVVKQKHIRGKRHDSLSFYDLNKGVFLKPFDKEEHDAGFEKSRYDVKLNNTEESFNWITDTVVEMPHEENNIIYTIDLEKRLVKMKNIK